MSGGAQRTACKRWSDSKTGLEPINLGVLAAIIVSNCNFIPIPFSNITAMVNQTWQMQRGEHGGGWNPMEDSTERRVIV